MKRMHRPFCRRMIRGGMAMVLLVGALAVVGCDNDDDGGGNFVDATPAQLANQSFALADGAALDGSLANQAMNLTFGPFDASNTAPFQVQSGDTSSSGTATLQSPLTLTFLIVDAGLPFAVNQQISLDARVDPDGRLEVSNTQTGATSTSDPGTESPAPPVVLLATLSGGQEVPGVTTAGSGSAAVTFNADRTRIAYTLAYTGLTDVTQAHIHAGAAGENGPVILFLCTNLANVPQDVPTPQACPTPDGTLTGTLTAADLLPNEEADVTTFAEAVDALLSGNAYANVHTATVASGEIRGQIGAAELQATLSGTQEVPPVETPGSGSGTLRLNDTQTVLTYTLDYTDVTDVTQAHVHVGTAEENGPVVLFLCTNLDAPQGVPAPQACPTPAGMVSGTLSAADLIAVEGAMAFAEAVNAVLSGNTYMNVHSTNFPAGEIRGKVRPRIIEFADAAIFFEFNATDLDLGLQLFFDGEGWRAVEVSSPDGTIFKVSNGGSLQEIGSTEVFTESEEPELTESEDPTDAEIDAAIAAFQERFQEGEYAFAGETVEGDRLEGTAVLTHDLPAAPRLVFPDPEAAENIANPAATVIEWADASEAGDPAIVRYQVVVEFEEAETERVFEFVADVSATTRSVTVPPEFFANLAGLEGEYKAEVLAVEASGNRTISEQEFEVEAAEPAVVAALAVTRQAIIEFADAAIFFEFNATDLDLGLQLFFDADGWPSVEVSSPDGGTLFQVMNDGGLQEIGSTEVFTESEEPGLTESEDPTDAEIDAAIAAFLARFPAGEYAFAGITIEGETIEGTAMLTHNLPAAPQLVFPDPEADENIADPVDTVITWEAGDPAVVRYQVVVEFEEEGTERVFEVSVDVLADPEAATQSVTIPPEFFAGLAGLEGEYKAEVLAVEASGNRTISEQEFEVGE